MYTSLVHLSRPVKVEDLYCFQYRSKSDLPQHTGWTFFDLGAEFARQGLPNKSWVTCSLNLQYRYSTVQYSIVQSAVQDLPDIPESADGPRHCNLRPGGGLRQVQI